METDPTPPPYDNTVAARDEKWVSIADETIDGAAGPSNQQSNAEDEQPHIILFVRPSMSTKTNAKKWKNTRDAVMRYPSSTYAETRAFLDKRLSLHKSQLGLPQDSETSYHLFYTKQEGSREPWFDSNWHNSVPIKDEQSWRACKALLAKNENSILMVVISPVEGVDSALKDEEEIKEEVKIERPKAKKKEKSCTVQ